MKKRIKKILVLTVGITLVIISVLSWIAIFYAGYSINFRVFMESWFPNWLTPTMLIATFLGISGGSCILLGLSMD
jgi:hypothetical protein